VIKPRSRTTEAPSDGEREHGVPTPAFVNTGIRTSSLWLWLDVSGISGSGGNYRFLMLPLSVALRAVTVRRVRVRWRVALLYSAAEKRTVAGRSVRVVRSCDDGAGAVWPQSSPRTRSQPTLFHMKEGSPTPGIPENQPRLAVVDVPLSRCRGSADPIAGRPIAMRISGEGSSVWICPLRAWICSISVGGMSLRSFMLRCTTLRSDNQDTGVQ
jgi:hypothetical protein